MSLANTIWPPDLPVPQALRDWLSELFMTVDSKAENSGEKLAALFTSDGIMYGMQGKAVGSEAIAASRKHAWKVVSSRNHEVLRVYLGDRKFGSILIIGKLVAGLQNGNTVDTEFIAQINLEGVTEGRPKGKLYKVWGDSAPWTKAMQL